MKKGLIKVQEVPSRRYAYYLTPQGFSEKSRLTASYLSYSFGFFRQARAACARSLAQAAGRGWRRAALAGAGDLAEIAAICALESKLEIVAVIDPGLGKDSFAGLPVVARAEDLRDRIDGVVVTDLVAAQEAYDRAVRALGRERVAVPEILAKAIEPRRELAAEAGA